MTTGARLSDLLARGKPAADTRPVRIAVRAGGVRVWQTPLDVDAADLSECKGVLSADEQLRASTFRSAIDRRRFIVARARLRQILSHCLETTPIAIRFGYLPRGKPYLAAPAVPLHFSVSHARNLAVFAIADNCRPGIDIECLDRVIDVEGVARRFFTANETAALLQTAHADRQRVFMAIWTRKEALVKALGEGLALSLNRIEVSTAPEGKPEIVAADDERFSRCTLHQIAVAHGYVASMATYRGNPSR